MNVLQLTNKARDFISSRDLNEFVISITVSVSGATISNRPEINLSLRQFDNEETLIRFGIDRFPDANVMRFEQEIRLPFISFRADICYEDYVIRVGMMTHLDRHGIKPPVKTTFGALSR